MTTHYWDASVWLAILNNDMPEEDIEHCHELWKKAKAGDLKILTSAICLTEVVQVKGYDRLSQENEEKINGFFRYSFVIVRDADRRTCEFARQLMWEHTSLKHKDAIHLATAILANVDIVNAYDRHFLALDKKIKKYDESSEMPIERPNAGTIQNSIKFPESN